MPHTFTLPTNNLPHIFHCMAHVPPTSPQYECVTLVSQQENETCYAYRYHERAFFVPLPHDVLVVHNRTVYDLGAGVAHFHMSCPYRTLYDLMLRLEFLPQAERDTTECVITVVSFVVHWGYVPPFLLNRIAQHILHQVEADFQTMPLPPTV